jgi:hypothetical protein
MSTLREVQCTLRSVLGKPFTMLSSVVTEAVANPLSISTGNANAMSFICTTVTPAMIDTTCNTHANCDFNLCVCVFKMKIWNINTNEFDLYA